MPSFPRDLLVRLGGGDLTVLETVPQDRKRFAQMAGVLLTTAGVAALSMSFALHNGVRVPLLPAIVVSLLWGVVIFNLDRFLVLSMGDTRTRGWRLFWLMVPRFLLAVVLAAVVSTPLVLRIFASDINRQISVLHEQQSQQFAAQEAHSVDQLQANALSKTISTDQGILSGHLPQTVVSPTLAQAQAQVAQLQPEVQQDFQTANAKYEAWQCELDGQTCDGGSGRAGNGALAHSKEVAYDQAEAAYQSEDSQLKAAQATVNGDQSAYTATEKQRLKQEQGLAGQALPGLRTQLAAVEKKIQAAVANADNVDNADTGILEQLQALSAASSSNSSLAAARWTVLALFFMIEILPVTIKALLNLGDPTAYERVVREREEAIADRERILRAENTRREEDKSLARIKKAQDRIRQSDLDAQAGLQIAGARAEMRVKVQQDMRSREEGIGKKANEHVAGQMTKIIDSALEKWSEEIRARLSVNGYHPENDGSPQPEEERNDGYDLPPEDDL